MGLIGLNGPDWLAQRDRRRRVKELEVRYYNSLVRAAYDLSSRLHNICEFRFLQSYRNPDEQFHAETSTLWLVGRYFGWVHLLRRDAHSLALGGVPRGRRLLDLLEAVERSFSTDSRGPPLLVRAQQSALGELMSVERPTDDRSRDDCLGYASFVDSLKEDRFRSWFEPFLTKLRDDESSQYERVKEVLIPLEHLTVFLSEGVIAGQEKGRVRGWLLRR